MSVDIGWKRIQTKELEKYKLKANEGYTFGSLYTVIWKILQQAKNL